MTITLSENLYMGTATPSYGGSGGGVSLDQIIVKSATIPTAGSDFDGAVYQYVGETNSTYTHGYIYECIGDEDYYARALFEPTKMVFDENVGVLKNFFSEITPNYLQIETGRFKYLEAGDIWNINGLDEDGNVVFENYQLYTQDLIDSGFVFIVPMTDISDGEEISYELKYFDTTIYRWERIDVQPVEQTYDPTSTNAQSGIAVSDAINSSLGNIETLLSEV